MKVGQMRKTDRSRVCENRHFDRDLRPVGRAAEGSGTAHIQIWALEAQTVHRQLVLLSRVADGKPKFIDLNGLLAGAIGADCRRRVAGELARPGAILPALGGTSDPASSTCDPSSSSKRRRRMSIRPALGSHAASATTSRRLTGSWSGSCRRKNPDPTFNDPEACEISPAGLKVNRPWPEIEESRSKPRSRRPAAIAISSIERFRAEKSTPSACPGAPFFQSSDRPAAVWPLSRHRELRATGRLVEIELKAVEIDGLIVRAIFKHQLAAGDGDSLQSG